MDGESMLNQRLFANFLSVIGAALVVSLLLWIASSQLSIIKSQAVLQGDFQHQAEVFSNYNLIDKKEDIEVKEWLKQIWPRLRVHGENAIILKRHLEDVCACDIELKKPEKF